ncbi:MAG: putative CRISPR-associated protein [Bacteroidia bacterium]|nr:putative CRISPR-associated protein [Bacteroidia bacterium]
MRLILSPVGTSILTNQAGEQSRMLRDYANASRQETPDKVIQLTEGLKAKAKEKLATAAVNELRQASAELNGILGLYDGTLPTNSNDMQVLIATDTYQGQTAADLIADFLRRYFPNTQIYIPPGLNTNSKADFIEGIKELLNWCDETLPGYRADGTEIIFNLTGGFKSLQGYLNTIGMFYADRIAYIFEAGQELITIPRLPVSLEQALFEENASLFLRLSQASAVNGLAQEELSAIPEVMLDCVEGRCVLSTWGTLAWNNVKQDVLSAQLIALPRIIYEDSFKKDFRSHTQAEEKVKLQEAIAKIACILHANNGDTASLKGGQAGGLLYDKFSGKNSHLGHFRLGQGPRVSCEAKTGTLLLRHFGPHDYVNNNP